MGKKIKIKRKRNTTNLAVTIYIIFLCVGAAASAWLVLKAFDEVIYALAALMTFAVLYTIAGLTGSEIGNETEYIEEEAEIVG